MFIVSINMVFNNIIVFINMVFNNIQMAEY